MHFSALSALFIVHAYKAHVNQLGLLVVGAIFAALCCTSKYPGGITLLPLFIANYLILRDQGQLNVKSVISSNLLLLAVFTATFLLTTPGALVEPTRFIRDVMAEVRHYKSGHGGHTLEAGFEHAWRLTTYLSQSLLSRFLPIAFILFSFAILGAYSFTKKEGRVGIILLSVPVAYVLYFCTQVTMIVRNYLILVPFLSIFSALGLRFAIEKFRVAARWRRLAYWTLAACIVFNLGWLAYAGESIRTNSVKDYPKEIANYFAGKPLGKYYLSESIRQRIKATSMPGIQQFANDPQAAEFYVLLSSDVPRAEWRKWEANRRGMYEIIAGPLEVNFDYYPNWHGTDRIVKLDIGDAQRMGLLR